MSDCLEKFLVGDGGSRWLEARAAGVSGPLPPSPHPLPHPLVSVGRACSPSRHGQDARATGRSSGAKASSLCVTGKMPVLPGEGSREMALGGG